MHISAYKAMTSCWTSYGFSSVRSKRLASFKTRLASFKTRLASFKNRFASFETQNVQIDFQIQVVVVISIYGNTGSFFLLFVMVMVFYIILVN